MIVSTCAHAPPSAEVMSPHWLTLTTTRTGATGHVPETDGSGWVGEFAQPATSSTPTAAAIGPVLRMPTSTE